MPRPDQPQSAARPDPVRYLPCKNESDETIPPYGLVRVTGVDDDGLFLVDLPDRDSSNDLYANGPIPIAAGRNGQIQSTFPALVAYEASGGDPAAGEVWGVAVDDWILYRERSGFVVKSDGVDGVCLVDKCAHKDTRIVEITSRVTVDGRLPGRVSEYDPVEKTWSDYEEVWVVEERPAYVHTGYANGRPVYTGGSSAGTSCVIDYISSIEDCLDSAGNVVGHRELHVVKDVGSGCAVIRTYWVGSCETPSTGTGTPQCELGIVYCYYFTIAFTTPNPVLPDGTAAAGVYGMSFTWELRYDPTLSTGDASSGTYVFSGTVSLPLAGHWIGVRMTIVHAAGVPTAGTVLEFTYHDDDGDHVFTYPYYDFNTFVCRTVRFGYPAIDPCVTGSPPWTPPYGFPASISVFSETCPEPGCSPETRQFCLTLSGLTGYWAALNGTHAMDDWGYIDSGDHALGTWLVKLVREDYPDCCYRVELWLIKACDLEKKIVYRATPLENCLPLTGTSDSFTIISEESTSGAIVEASAPTTIEISVCPPDTGTGTTGTGTGTANACACGPAASFCVSVEDSFGPGGISGQYTLTHSAWCEWTGTSSCDPTKSARLVLDESSGAARTISFGTAPGYADASYHNTAAAGTYDCNGFNTFTKVSGNSHWPGFVYVGTAGDCPSVTCDTTGTGTPTGTGTGTTPPGGTGTGSNWACSGCPSTPNTLTLNARTFLPSPYDALWGSWTLAKDPDVPCQYYSGDGTTYPYWLVLVDTGEAIGRISATQAVSFYSTTDWSLDCCYMVAHYGGYEGTDPGLTGSELINITGHGGGC